MFESNQFSHIHVQKGERKKISEQPIVIFAKKMKIYLINVVGPFLKFCLIKIGHFCMKLNVT